MNYVRGLAAGRRLLSSKSVEEDDYLLPCLEVVAAPLYRGAHKLGLRSGSNEVVAIDKLALIGEEYVSPCRSTQIFLHPCHVCHHLLGSVGRRRGEDIDIVMFEQCLVSLVHGGCGVSVAVAKSLDVDIDNRAFTLLLTVVDVTDKRQQIVHGYLVGQTMFAVEGDGVGVMAAEEVEGVDHGIGIAEKTVDAIRFCQRLGGEARWGGVCLFLYQTLGDHELLHAVKTGILEDLLAGELRHRLAHLKSGIDKDAVEAV